MESAREEEKLVSLYTCRTDFVFRTANQDKKTHQEGLKKTVDVLQTITDPNHRKFNESEQFDSFFTLYLDAYTFNLFLN
jgi:hypothetical protein